MVSSAFTPVQVVNRYHLKDLRGVESVQRPGPLGNPWKAGVNGTREQVISLYETWLTGEYVCGRMGARGPAFEELIRLARIEPLIISCTCKPKACHADIVARIIEQMRREGIPEPTPPPEDGF